MNYKKYLGLVLLALLSIHSPLFGQDTGTEAPSPSPTPTSQDIPTYSQPATIPKTLYRKVAEQGIIVAYGAEITLSNVPIPTTRAVSWQNGHLDVIDTAQDGTVTITSWDISELTAPYQPGNPLKGGYINNQVLGGILNPGNDDIAPDLLPHECPVTVITDQSSNTTVALGSVLVDDENRLFYTPPTGTMFFPMPDDVLRIESVTHLDNGGTIAAEWIKQNEDNYHMVQIDTSSASVVTDTTPDDKLNVQKILTWIDGDHFLGRFCGRKADEFNVISVSLGAVQATASTADGVFLKVQNNLVNTYTISPD